VVALSLSACGESDKAIRDRVARQDAEINEYRCPEGWRRIVHWEAHGTEQHVKEVGCMLLAKTVHDPEPFPDALIMRQESAQ
jgi:hypothetical protein